MGLPTLPGWKTTQHAWSYDQFVWLHRSRRLINPFSIRVVIGIVIGLLVVVVFTIFGHSSTPV